MRPVAGPVGSDEGRVPLTVLTGFLGAGKTTFLNALLRRPVLADTAVIVNEFGEIGLDHLLVEAVDGELLVLTTGCVCCASRGDLLGAVRQLTDRRGEGAIAFDRIVVETTGLADPGPILNALVSDASLGGAVRLAGIVTVVSAVGGDDVLDRHDEARRQVAVADRLILSHGDLAAGDPDAEAALTRLRQRLCRLNPAASIDDAHDVGATADILLEQVSRFGKPERIEGPADAPHHHHAGDARIRALVLEAGPVAAAELHGFVAILQRRLGVALLRLKGIAELREDPARPAIVQAVGHLLHPLRRLDAWPDAAARQRATRLVVIVDDADPTAVTRLWDEFFGPPAIDRPDAAALMRGLDREAAGLFG